MLSCGNCGPASYAVGPIAWARDMKMEYIEGSCCNCGSRPYKCKLRAVSSRSRWMVSIPDLVVQWCPCGQRLSGGGGLVRSFRVLSSVVPGLTIAGFTLNHLPRRIRRRYSKSGGTSIRVNNDILGVTILCRSFKGLLYNMISLNLKIYPSDARVG